jgi:putative peptidoglycan lipid II flippase
VLAWRILSVRLRGLDGYHITRSLVRMYAASVPAALVAIIVSLLTGSAIVTVIIGGGFAMALYMLFARVLQIEELTILNGTVKSRFGR